MSSYGMREIILLSLKDCEVYKNQEEVPYGFSLSGLTNTLGSERDLISEKIKELIEEGLVEERKKYVRGRKRKRNVYFLTIEGAEVESKLRDMVKKETVKIKMGEDIKEIPLGDIADYIEQEDPLVKTLSSMEKYGILDLSEGMTPEDVFVGRKEEMNKLRDTLKDVKKSGSHTVFISGEAGVGKTRLISEFKRYVLEEDYDFLLGTCLNEMADPYLPFKEAFSGHIKESDGVDIKSMSRVAFVGAIRGIEVSNKKMFDVEREATFYETAEYIRSISKETPLVVFLDDVQWMDKASAQILNYMTYKLGPSPVFFICAYRPEDMTDDVSIKFIFQHMKNSCTNVTHIELSLLGEDSTKRLIKGVLQVEDVPETFVHMIHEKTSGNPLFVKECVKHMLEEGALDPETNTYPKRQDVIRVPNIIQTVIERRANRLNSKSKRILEVGSVIGDVMDFTLLSEVMDVNTFDLLDQIDILVAAGLWQESLDEETIFFHHSLTRDTVYDGLRDIKKRLLHYKVATCIEKLHSRDTDKVSPLLAYHYKKGQKYEKAFKYYKMAGNNAKDVYAHEDAIEMFENALDMADMIESGREKTLDIKEELADIYLILGDYDKARGSFQSILENDTDKERALRMYRKTSEAWLNQSHFNEALVSVNQGLSLLEDEDDFDLTLCKLLSLKGWVYLRMDIKDQAPELFKRENDIALKINDERSIGRSYHDLGTLHYLEGKLDLASKYLQDAIEVWKRLGEDPRLTTSLNNIGLVKMYRGEWDQAERYFKENLENYKRIGDNLGIGISFNNLGDVYREKGEFEAALECFEKSKSIDEKLSNTDGVAGCINNMGITYYKMGELDNALEHHLNSLHIYRETGNKSRCSWVLQCMGEVYMAKGEFEKALEVLEESYEIKLEISDDPEIALNLVIIAEVLLESGDINGAQERAERALESSQKLMTKEVMGRASKVLGKVHREKGKFDLAERELNKSKDILKGIAITEYPKTLYEIGALHKTNGELTMAIEYFSEALETFQSIGMNSWVLECSSAMDEIKGSVGKLEMEGSVDEK